MALNFEGLDTENFGSWPWAVKSLVVAVFSILLLVAGYMFDVRSQQEELSIAVAEQKKLQKKFKKKYKLAANLEEYEDQVRQIEQSFGELLRQLPESTEVPGLVDDISRAAVENNLSITSIKLLKEEKKDFYNEQPIEIIVNGGFHQLGQFVSDVSSLSRIVTLHNFTIKAAIQGERGRDLTMKVTAKTYRYVVESIKDDESETEKK